MPVTFSRISPDGENGFPGEFQVSVTYEFTEDNTLQIYYSGISDKATAGKYDQPFLFQPYRGGKRQGS